MKKISFVFALFWFLSFSSYAADTESYSVDISSWTTGDAVDYFDSKEAATESYSVDISSWTTGDAVD